jgi:hypothetical protein
MGSSIASSTAHDHGPKSRVWERERKIKDKRQAYLGVSARDIHPVS